VGDASARRPYQPYEGLANAPNPNLLLPAFAGPEKTRNRRRHDARQRPGVCRSSLHLTRIFHTVEGGGGDAKSSVRSAMFIATRAARSAKLRRSGMYSRSLGHCRRSVGAKIPIHAAPTELGRASGVVVTINMALLTELDPSPSPKMRVRCRVLRRLRGAPGCLSAHGSSRASRSLHLDDLNPTTDPCRQAIICVHLSRNYSVGIQRQGAKRPGRKVDTARFERGQMVACAHQTVRPGTASKPKNGS
jgi:hypothetical protein